MRTIDADKMILRYQSHPNRHSKTYLSCITYEDVLDAVIYDLEQEPTVDAVEVVRCGECRYYRNGGCLTGRYDLKDNDFCSWGERREDD